MMNLTEQDESESDDPRSLSRVALTGLAMMLMFGVIAMISAPFGYGEATTKPILTVVGLLMLATAVSVWAIKIGMGVVGQQKQLVLLIVALGIGFRVVMLLTPPILEIDYYRYLWDGKVTAAGVSPYKYSPQTVIDACPPQPSTVEVSDQLTKLTELAISSTSNREILSRIHFPELTTIYPPMSQLVFWAAAKVVPADSSVWLHMLAIRATFVAFDLGTILLLAILLRGLNRHMAWLIAYAWNPLVIKEIANSGHLDSLAVFLMVLAVLLVLRARRVESGSLALMCGVALGLAVGAKLFPVILVPAFLGCLAGSGWKSPTQFCLAFSMTCLAILFPMFGGDSADGAIESATVQSDIQISQQEDSDGLKSFLSSWRINDAIFSSIYFNLKPNDSASSDYWYVIVPNSVRRQVSHLPISDYLGGNPAFRLTRVITLSLFAVCYLTLLPRLMNGSDQEFLVGILFVLFFFLMLQPTVNPWYWLWAVPFTCFCSRWGWTAVSGVLLLYYVRFYFQISSLEFDFFQRTYWGVEIFDHIIVWIELLLIVLSIAVAGRLVASANRSNSVA